MKFIKQCKGKDIDNIPLSKLENEYYFSTKYDGNYVQIHKKGDKVKFYTSGGKQFYLIDVADTLIKENKGVDFIIETEYIGHTDGKLGSRGKCTTTTFRTLFKKGLPAYGNGVKFMAFDVIYYYDTSTIHPYTDRPINFRGRLELLDTIKGIDIVAHAGPVYLDVCKQFKDTIVKGGYEGAMCYSPNHIYNPGKRQNTSVKLKGRPTADLQCIGTTDGEGKYEGMIGALVLEDDDGLVVSVGSGLDDTDRNMSPDYYIGETIEVQYEQILDTYVQPVFKCIRKDK